MQRSFLVNYDSAAGERLAGTAGVPPARIGDAAGKIPAVPASQSRRTRAKSSAPIPPTAAIGKFGGAILRIEHRQNETLRGTFLKVNRYGVAEFRPR